MHQDLLAGGAHGFAQTDFKRSFGDAYQHDVHNDDAADNQGDQGDGNHHRGDTARELIDLIVQRFHVDEAEVVFFISFQAVLVAHRHARVFDHRLKVFASPRLAMNLQTVASKDLQVCRRGNVDVPVERIAKESAALVFDADDAHRHASHLECLPDRIDVRKKFVFDVAAEHAHQRRPLYFIGRDESAIDDCLVFDLSHVRGDTENNRTRKLDGVLLEICLRADLDADFGTCSAVVAHPFVIVPVQTLVAAIAAFVIVIRHASLESHARNHEVVRAQQLRNFVSYISVQATDRRAHDNYGGDADDDSDQSQERAQLMRQDRLHRDSRRVRIK